MTFILDGHKLAWHKERVDAWMRGERIAPITIDMALTRACQYNCVYCYSKLQENKATPLSWEVLCSFLDDAAEIGVKAISLVSDGESTLHKDWVDFIIAGKSRGLDMALGTNGGFVDYWQLQAVLPHLTYIRFNISAADPFRYAEIHGVKEKVYFSAVHIIESAVEIKKKLGLDVTIGLQMVLMPQFADQIITLAQLGRDMGVDYLVIKHCSDDENGQLGIDYSKYTALTPLLKEAEAMSTDTYQVSVKWSKVLSGGKRNYSQCYGAPFLMQLSGSGLVAPCGMLFHDRYKAFHIGNIAETRFKDLWKSDRYWDVMHQISGPTYNAKRMCGSLCLQHKVNEYLTQVRNHNFVGNDPIGPRPQHINFV